MWRVEYGWPAQYLRRLHCTTFQAIFKSGRRDLAEGPLLSPGKARARHPTPSPETTSVWSRPDHTCTFTLRPRYSLIVRLFSKPDVRPDHKRINEPILHQQPRCLRRLVCCYLPSVSVRTRSDKSWQSLRRKLGLKTREPSANSFISPSAPPSWAHHPGTCLPDTTSTA